MASPNSDNYPGVSESQDEQHLKLLSIFYYVIAGLLAVFACIPVIHLTFGIIILVNPEMMDGPEGSPEGPPPGFPQFMGAMFAVMGGAAILLGWTMASVAFFAGRSIARRRRHTFCMVAAAVVCLWMPLGTVLGVFTLIVLVRPSVKQLFEFYSTPQPNFK